MKYRAKPNYTLSKEAKSVEIKKMKKSDLREEGNTESGERFQLLTPAPPPPISRHLQREHTSTGTRETPRNHVSYFSE